VLPPGVEVNIRLKMKTTKRAALVSFALIAIAALGLTGSAFAGTTYSNVQKSKWTSCTACAGTNGSGPGGTISQTLYIKSPSLTGAASQYYLAGYKAYSDALWWKQLGANSSVANFKYDLYFYIKNPTASQALEFDVNQSLGGKKYIFGTECSIKSTGTWHVWSSSAKWQNTGIPCHAPTAYKWHHLTEQFQRVNGHVKFVSITLDGHTSYVNRSFYPQGSSAKELNVAFQMDSNLNHTPYQVWLDKVSLTAW